MPDYLPQPLPHEFHAKRVLFDRLVNMGIEMARSRRRMGYVWLRGGVLGMDGVDGDVLVEAHQSGLIEVKLNGASELLRMERDTYVWDETMFASRMQD